MFCRELLVGVAMLRNFPVLFKYKETLLKIEGK